MNFWKTLLDPARNPVRFFVGWMAVIGSALLVFAISAAIAGVYEPLVGIGIAGIFCSPAIWFMAVIHRDTPDLPPTPRHTEAP